MISFPKAKINIGLRITGKREDGFHNIETVFYPTGLTDALEFVEEPGKGPGDELTVTGIDIGSQGGTNLVIRAVEEVRKLFPVPPLRIHLHKAIPPGGGLGGGSSDAASIIRALRKRYSLPLSNDEMRAIALKLGSDVPYFIDPVPSYATGRGEILEPSDQFLKGYFLVLVNPGTGISTREAYLNCSPAPAKESLKTILEKHVSVWKDHVFNNFEDYVFKVQPLAGELKKALYIAGALFSSMSGSGSTVYGIFDRRPELSGLLRACLIWEGLL